MGSNPSSPTPYRPKLNNLKYSANRQASRSVASLFSTKTPDEQISEQVLEHTINREIHKINRIDCNAIISGTPYAADKVEVAKVLGKVDSVLARVQEWHRISNRDKTPGSKIQVTFEDSTQKKHACKNAFQLRNAGITTSIKYIWIFVQDRLPCK